MWKKLRPKSVVLQSQKKPQVLEKTFFQKKLLQFIYPALEIIDIKRQLLPKLLSKLKLSTAKILQSFFFEVQ